MAHHLFRRLWNSMASLFAAYNRRCLDWAGRTCGYFQVSASGSESRMPRRNKSSVLDRIVKRLAEQGFDDRAEAAHRIQAVERFL